ncbi:MAG: leucine-rich repeat domain-containing protein [Anaeroplasma bactoclasticum]|nr:leucine-rich repeat domain-containing protein [Anaeroplasma bactoclasticum]
MKKNKLLVVLLCLLCFVFIMTACDKKCDHKYNTKYDDTYHWYECEYCFDIEHKEKHNTSGANKECTVCHYKEKHIHSWGNWKEEPATCTAPGKKMRSCSSCGEEETEVIAALKHNYKDGYCTRCDEADPENPDLVEGREFTFVKISDKGLLTYSRLKCASKYTLKISSALNEVKTIELDRTQDSYSLSDLPVGRTMVTLTAYEKTEIKVDNETYYQDVPIDTATDEFRITKVNNTYTLVRLKYTDEYITLEGFYDEPRIDSQTNEKYYLYETVYKAPSLSNIMNNSHIKDAKNFKLKDSSKYKLVYYESDGKTSFVLGGNHYINVERATFMKYYIAVVEKNTDVEVKRYPIQTYGLTSATIEFKKLTIKEVDGVAQVVETQNLLDEPILMTEKDILSSKQISSYFEDGLLARTQQYSILQKDEDLIVPTSDLSGKVILYFYEEDLVLKDCSEYEELSKVFRLKESEYGWSLYAITNEKDVVVPAYIAFKPVISASFDSLPIESLTLSEGIQMWIVSVNNCSNLTRIALPSTITYMEHQSFNGIRRDCEIYCNFSKSKGDSFVTNWNQIVGTYYTYTTHYIDTPILKDGCQIEIIDGKGVIMGYTDDFTGTIPSVVLFGTKEYLITKIESSAFYGFEVSQIILPSALEEIGNTAFANCINLTSITLPKGVVTIGDSAFYGCTKLLEVYNLSALDIEAGSIAYGYVGYYAKKIYKEEGESNIILQGDYTFYKDDENNYSLIGYSGHEADLVLPKDINGSGYQIYKTAFEESTFLSSITISDGVIGIEERTFSSCPLKSIYYDGNLEEWCSSRLDSYMLFPASNLYLKNSVGEWEKITKLILPQAITEIKENQFYGLYTITSITIPVSLERIGINALFRCSITNIYYEGSLEDWCSSNLSGKDFFSEGRTNHFFLRNIENEWEEVTSLILPQTITEIKENQFYAFNSVVTLTIPNTVLTIGENAFLNCTKIDEAFIPAIGISHISRYARSITITGGKAVGGFSRNITSITILDGVESIDERAFRYCTNLKTLIIPQSVGYIGEDAFIDCNALEYNIYDNGCYLGNDDNPYVWLIKSKNTYIQSCTIHQDTKYIYTQAFYSCNDLTTVHIPAGVVHIATDAFTVYCNKLSYAYYEGDLESWCNLKVQIFPYYGNSNHFYLKNENDTWEEVTSLVIPNTIIEISDYQFNAFNNLTSLIIPESVKTIGNGSFRYCSKLEKIQIKNGVESIGNQAFYWCDSLLNLELPDSIRIVKKDVFSRCDYLKYLIINNGIKEIGDNLISYTHAEAIYFKGTEEEWQQISIGNQNTNLDSITKYFYQETEPTQEGNYWHYVDNIPTKWE